MARKTRRSACTGRTEMCCPGFGEGSSLRKKERKARSRIASAHTGLSLQAEARMGSRRGARAHTGSRQGAAVRTGSRPEVAARMGSQQEAVAHRDSRQESVARTGSSPALAGHMGSSQLSEADMGSSQLSATRTGSWSSARLGRKKSGPAALQRNCPTANRHRARQTKHPGRAESAAPRPFQHPAQARGLAAPTQRRPLQDPSAPRLRLGAPHP
jgi:hypothetical protein